MGAFREHRQNRLGVFPDETGGVGGNTITLLAAGALNIGDLVSLTAAGHVNKTLLAADMIRFVGIVIGGGSAPGGGTVGADFARYGTDAVGTAAATAAEQAVVIQVDGIAYVVADAAVAAIVPVTNSAIVAGRVSVTGATAGQIIGLTIDAGAGAASVIRIKIQPR